jgi:hypothetical protein
MCFLEGLGALHAQGQDLADRVGGLVRCSDHFDRALGGGSQEPGTVPQSFDFAPVFELGEREAHSAARAAVSCPRRSWDSGSLITIDTPAVREVPKHQQQPVLGST